MNTRMKDKNLYSTTIRIAEVQCSKNVSHDAAKKAGCNIQHTTWNPSRWFN